MEKKNFNGAFPAWVWLAIALGLSSLVPLWSVRYPPLQDYPYHLVRAWIFSGLDDAGFVYSGTFERSFFPVPYSLADFLLAALQLLWPIEIAGKVLLSLYLLALPAGLFFFLHAIDEEATVWGFSGFLLASTWSFHMGFLNYVLGLPPILFALGFWWRRRYEMTRGRQAILAVLIFLTYLAHLYAWGLLLLVCLVLGLTHLRQPRVLAGAFLPFVPTLLLFGLSLLERASGAGGHASYELLIYGGPLRKLWVALGCFPSFSLTWETVILALAGGLGAASFVFGRRVAQTRPFFAVLGALLAVYLLLPERVAFLAFVSARMPPLLALLATAVLPVPKNASQRRGLLAAFVALSLLWLVGLERQYLRIDRKLSDDAAVIAAVPAGADVGFEVDQRSMSEGRIAPAAIFSGYHFLRGGGRDIPGFEHFVGFLRAVRYRAGMHPTFEAATALPPAQDLANLLGPSWSVGRGGLLICLGRPEEQLGSTATPLGYRRVWRTSWLEVYLRERIEPAATPSYFTTGGTELPQYLVVYQDPERGEPEVASGYALVLERGPAHLYHRAAR